MAQMAPALTEANASPGSSRKNSVDRCYSSTVTEELKQGSLSSGVDLKLLSRNGLVRLLEDTDSSNNITNINGGREESSHFSSPPISKRYEDQFKITDMPNEQCDGSLSIVMENKSKTTNVTNDSQNRKPAIPSSDLSQRTCASTTTTQRPTGACDIESENEENRRITQHPVATLDTTKTAISKRTLKSIEQQSRLASRAKKLEKRLRRLQTRQIATHVHRQLNGIVNHHKGKYSPSSSTTKQELSAESVDNLEKSNVYSDTGAKEAFHAKALLSCSGTDKDSVISFQDKGSRNASSNNNPCDDRYENAIKYSPESVNKTIRNALIEEKQKYEAESLAESLRAHVEHLEAMDDSDATEASSEDESEDEEYYSSSLQSKTSRCLRHQYRNEEGEISSQWSWLQSQIVNLERQIRRYEDLFKNARIAKQPVKLHAINVISKNQNPLSEVNNSLPSPLAGQSVKLNNVKPTQPELDFNKIKEPESHLRNGMKKALLHETMVDEDELPLKKLRTKLLKNDANDNYSVVGHSNNNLSECARTRGTLPIARRRLVHLSWMQERCKARKRFCHCSKPETPCLSCSKIAQTIPVVESSQSKAERVALLDHSYHAVLSFPTEIPLQFHFASLLKKGGFESRTQPVKPFPVKTSNIDKKKQKSNRRAQLAKGAAASLLSSAKLRNQKYERKRNFSSLPSTPKNAKSDSRECHTDNIPRKKRAAAISAAQLQKRARSLSLPCTAASSPSTPASSPSPTPPLSNSLPPSTLSLMLRKKRTSNAFDINNIVIPYSMASSTRVEKLQYKEILTPNWRVLEIENEEEQPQEEVPEIEEDQFEDLRDEVMAQRHDICEEQERRRFLGYLNKKRKRSSRQSSETDGGFEAGSTPPGTPLLHSPSPTSASVPAPSAITPSLHRSFSLDTKLGHRRSSSTESLQRIPDTPGESWPTVNPWQERTFPLSDADEAALKLPTPMPTPIPSRPTSPMASAPPSPMCSPLASPESVESNDTIEDKNEWTVKLVTTEQESGGEQPRKGIVLKLAKR
ncbi:KAT8 regulatory NSL complex subunit 1 isoform X2 [Nematostella vectensis]|nr:KAT8 regulatory NSL complex subunit 1 isoform X2 [Nematostella vectensis]